MPLGLDASQSKSFGLAGRAVEERKPLVSDDMASDPRVLLAKEAARHGLRSVAVFPLVRSGEADAVLALYSEDVGFFDAEEMKLLHELAGDISFALENIAKEEKLEYFAFYDLLTGLPNRALFRERLNQRVNAATHDGDHLAVVLLDTERFQTVNDSLGRQAGDELLKQIAARCSRFATDPELLARLTGDQFAVVFPELRSADEAARTL
jgi:predicted signal transduction protein with EAL and GGDEF domain